jgi:predicted SAM-dependent methyltransferase
MPVLLNLGCGHDVKPRGEGWVNVDCVPYSGIDVLADARDLRMFASDSVDCVYARSLIEHFYPKEIPIVLIEWARVLRSGGTLEMTIPCLEGLAEAIQSGRFPCDEINEWIYAYQYIEPERHKYFFSSPRAIQLLESVGFVEIDVQRDSNCIWAMIVHAKKR